MKKAFTLVELLVVIAVIGILSAIITPNLLNARNSARIAAGQRFDSSTYHSIGDYLVGEWMFDVPGSALIDTSGFINNCSTSSTDTSPTYTTTGGYNGKGAYDFDGTNDYMQASISIPTTDFTYSAWVKLDTNNDEVLFMASEGSGQNMFIIATNASSAGKFTVYTNGILRLTGRTVINTGSWYHIASSKSNGLIKLFVNGKEDGSASDAGVVLNFSSCPLLIGADADGACVDSLGNYLNGLIDDIRVYATALSSSEIEKLYAKGKDLHQNLAEK